MRRSLALAALLAAALAPAAAQAKTYDARTLLRSAIVHARDGGVPVLVPSRIDLDLLRQGLRGPGGGNDQYALFLDARPRGGEHDAPQLSGL